MYHVVDPASRLLYAYFPPLSLAHQPTRRHVRGDIFRKNDMPAAQQPENMSYLYA